MGKIRPEKSQSTNNPAPKVDRKKRNKLQKFYLNLDEVAAIDRKRGRLSKSVYFRDRVLFNNEHHEPSIAAIGGVYQASGATGKSSCGVSRTIT